MKEKINNINFNSPLYKIINNVTAKAEDNPNIIKRLLIDQIYSTVQWRKSLINISDGGVKNFIEIGPGKVLSGLVKRINRDVKIDTVNSLSDIESLKV